MTYIATSSVVRRFVEVNLRAAHRRIWRTFRPASCSRPVFLIGCGRSGTDLIVENLSRSPELDVYNETHPQAFENWRLRDEPVLRSLVDKSCASCILFKPIVQTHHAQWMLRFSADARLIFACRNPWDTINSIVQFFPDTMTVVRTWANSHQHADYPINVTPVLRRSFLALYSADCTRDEMGALSWWARNSIFLELKLHETRRVRLVDYDAVVGNPEDEFRALCGFLRIQYRKSMMQGVSAANRGKHYPPQLSEPIYKACVDLWTKMRAVAESEEHAGTEEHGA